MMGRDHALSGALVFAALATTLHVNDAHLAAGVALCAGAGVLPDIDHQDTSVSSSFGFLTEGFSWLAHQRVLRTMTVLIGLLNLTLTAATAVLVLLVKERLHLGAVGYGTLFTCEAAGAILGSVCGDRLIRRVTATWTIRIGLLVEAGLHLVLATSRSAYFVGFMLFAFGVHAALWTIVGSSLRQRLTPPEMLGRVTSTSLFISAGGNCAGALLGGVIATRFGITAPYWTGFVIAVIVSATTWRVFNRATIARAYAEPAPDEAPGQRVPLSEVGDELPEQAGELLRCFLVGGVPGAWNQLYAAAPQAREGQLLQVAEVDQLLAFAVQDGQGLLKGAGDGYLVGEPALADAGEKGRASLAVRAQDVRGEPVKR